MKIGFPAAVKPTDDHPTHVRTMLDYMALKAGQGAQADPVELQRIQEHIAQHMAAFSEQDSKGARQLAAEVQELSNAVNQASQNAVPPEQAASQGGEPQLDEGGSPGAPELLSQPTGG